MDALKSHGSVTSTAPWPRKCPILLMSNSVSFLFRTVCALILFSLNVLWFWHFGGWSLSSNTRVSKLLMWGMTKRRTSLSREDLSKGRSVSSHMCGDEFIYFLDVRTKTCYPSTSNHFGCEQSSKKEFAHTIHELIMLAFASSTRTSCLRWWRSRSEQFETVKIHKTSPSYSSDSLWSVNWSSGVCVSEFFLA